MTKHRYDTETTRRELIESGRARFSESGYAAASTEQIVAATGLTRGALYHHFGNKKGLFEAVLEQVHTELAAEVDARARAAAGGPVEALRAGFHAWLDVALQDDVRRILLVDGPSVVGWETWHALDLHHGFGVTRRALDAAMRDGDIETAPVDELTHVLLGAVTQAGLQLGPSGGTRRDLDAYHAVIDLLIGRLRRE